MTDILLACSDPTVSSKGIWMTEKARDRLLALYENEHKTQPDALFRVRVDSGGCSGFQYFMGFDATRTPEDLVFQNGSLMIISDAISLPLLDGLHIDFVEELIGSSFQLKNPNAAMACGCGNSFTLNK